MKIIIATDHNGVKEKLKIIEELKEKYEIVDLSPNNYPTDDYPKYAIEVAEYIRDNNDSIGILLCGTGIGMSIAANKVKSIRCAHISNKEEAQLAKFHNNANIIALSYKNDINDILEWINTYLNTKFGNEERHVRRIKLIEEYERNN